MATYQIETNDGNTYQIETEDSPTSKNTSNGPWNDYKPAASSQNSSDSNGPWNDYAPQRPGSIPPPPPEEAVFGKIPPPPPEEQIFPPSTNAAQPPNAIQQLKQLASNPMNIAKALVTMANPVEGGSTVAAFNLANASGQVGQRAGDFVKGKALQNGMNPTLAKILGFGTSIAADPTTWLTGFGGAKAGQAGAEAAADAAKSILPTVLETTTGTPKAATEMFLKTKDFFRRYTGSTDAIEGAVGNLRDSLADVEQNAGKELQAVKEKLGVYKTPQERIYQLIKGVDNGGYSTKAANSTPEQLLAEATAFPATSGLMNPVDKLQAALDLQKALNDKISFAKQGLEKIGSETNGLLKYAASELGNTIDKMPGGPELASVRQKYAVGRQVYDYLQPKLAEPGHAEDFLSKVFESDSPGYKDFLSKLSEFQTLSGKPVVNDLFGQFAAKKLNQLSGGGQSLGKLLYTALGATGGLAMSGHPIAALGALGSGGVAALANSPYLMSRAVQGARAVYPVVTTAAKTAGGLAGVGLGGLAQSFQGNPNASQ